MAGQKTGMFFPLDCFVDQIIRCRNPLSPHGNELGLFFGHEKEKEGKNITGLCFFQTNLSFHNGTLRPGRFFAPPALKQDWMKKKTSRKSYCNDFCSPFKFQNLEKLKFPPKQKKQSPWGFLQDFVLEMVLECQDRRAKGFVWMGPGN